MTITYKKYTSPSGAEYIRRDNEDGSYSDIPQVEGNSDYAEYLESLEPQTKASKVVDEAAPE